MSTRTYYRFLQSLSRDRLLVDKTPFYAAHVTTLERAEEYFEQTLYIHLVRHPCAVVRSFQEVRLSQLWYPRLLGPGRVDEAAFEYSESQLAEMIWTVLQRNILSFLGRVPSQRQIRVSFEDLLSEPEECLRRIADFLGMGFVPAMLEPYADPTTRMTDGLHAESRMIGDVKFHQHTEISREPAERWRGDRVHPVLCDETLEVGRILGYDVEKQKDDHLEITF